MNKKGQYALEYLLTYGWALNIIAIVVGVMLFLTTQTPAEQWQEEWTCTQWKETGKLINCKEECCPEGEVWWERGKECVNEWTLNIAITPGGFPILEEPCHTTCDRETKCVQQTKTRCLVTTQKCSNYPEGYNAPQECFINEPGKITAYANWKVIENRECEAN